jgi:carbon-monoxide dehydrogenase large subunit
MDAMVSQQRKFGIGQAPKRVEDQRFITGAGRYTGDMIPEDALMAYVLRSSHAHARFTLSELDAARAMPGVAAILTFEDVADLGDLPCPGAVKNSDGSKMAVPPHPVLARDVARHVGDALAFIVAETAEQARDAAEAIIVDYESADPVVDIAGARTDGAPLVWPELGTNLAFDSDHGDAQKTEKAFAKAHRTVALELVNNRLIANFMELRACFAEYHPDDESWTMTVGSQGVHDIRDIIADHILKVDRAKLRVITPDVGGGFGTKIFVYREYPLCAVAALVTGRPVAWIGERGEHFLGDAQGRDNITRAEVALDRRGRFLGLKIDIAANLGAYLSQFAPFIPWGGARMSPGCYDIPAVHARVRAYYTNSPPIDAYRGAGRPEAAYVIERLVEHVAREIGKSPDALRALNFIKPEAMPHKTQTGRIYDSGEFEAAMRRAMEVADWAGFKERLRASKKAGKARGIGMASYIEACAGGSPERADISMGEDGNVQVLIGTQSNGQGHMTAYAQLVSQHLDLPLENITVIQGDTALIETGGGTGGSRSVPIGGAAVDGASRELARKLIEQAAAMLEAGEADLEISDGAVRVAGTDKAVSFAEIAARAAGSGESLATHFKWKPPEATYPNGTHICEVEIDPDTGETEILRYTVVDDFGVTMNPLLLAGQVHGGLAQGIGQALHERTIFDESGQLVTASLMDYRLPRAADLPNFHFETRNVPCATNALGMKGAGEAGTIGGTPAAMNAVVDALYRAYGIRHLDIPATPDRVFAAIQAARG